MPGKITSYQQADDELISSQVQEIISYRPHWIIRMGTGIFLLILLFLLGITWFIRYPESIHGPVRLISIDTSQSHQIYYAELITSQKGFGKIKSGQKVIIKLDSYPSTEFGYINGTVDTISNNPGNRDSLLVKIKLAKGLQTSHNQTIEFRNNLSGRADIIINEKRLLNRLLKQLVGNFNK